jgi:hypothetical protein
VGDDDDVLAVPLGREFAQEIAGRFDHLVVALPSGKRPVDACGAKCGDLGDRVAVQFAVVAFTQSPILVERNVSVVESDSGGLDSTVEVGGEHRVGAE